MVEKADATRRVYAVVGETDAYTLSYRVEGLFEGSEYLFAVRAVNKLGESDQCVTDEPVKAQLPFSKIKLEVSIKIYFELDIYRVCFCVFRALVV